MTLRDRFESYVEPEPTTGCWLWIGSKDKDGYGTLGVKTAAGWRHVKAHRVSYELFVGPIREGLEPDHLCRVRACVNWAHLEAVTHAQNCQRGEVGKYNSAKTHCPQGHPYSPENTKRISGNRRVCRTCQRKSDREAKRRSRFMAAHSPTVAELEDLFRPEPRE